MSNKTYAMIKPHAVKEGLSGDVIRLIELNGFKIIGMQKLKMTEEQAKSFYAIHKERPFFGELVQNIISGPIIALALEKENAVIEWRNLIGATNPAQAALGTIRKMFAKSISENVAHGSDSDENAKIELGFFFSNLI